MAAPALPLPAPEVRLQGIDPRGSATPAVPTLHLAAPVGVPRPRSVTDLLLPAASGSVRRLSVDVRHFARVLERRGGAGLLARIVRDPSDRVTNAVFRAVMRTPSRAGATEDDGADTDCVVRVAAAGSRDDVDLGRAHVALLALLTEGERATRRLAEVLARPRDTGLRRSLEEMLAARVADLPLGVLLRPVGGPVRSGGVDDQDVGPGPA